MAQALVYRAATECNLLKLHDLSIVIQVTDVVQCVSREC